MAAAPPPVWMPSGTDFAALRAAAARNGARSPTRAVDGVDGASRVQATSPPGATATMEQGGFCDFYVLKVNKRQEQRPRTIRIAGKDKGFLVTGGRSVKRFSFSQLAQMVQSCSDPRSLYLYFPSKVVHYVFPSTEQVDEFAVIATLHNWQAPIMQDTEYLVSETRMMYCAALGTSASATSPGYIILDTGHRVIEVWQADTQDEPMAVLVAAMHCTTHVCATCVDRDRRLVRLCLGSAVRFVQFSAVATLDRFLGRLRCLQAQLAASIGNTMEVCALSGMPETWKPRVAIGTWNVGTSHPPPASQLVQWLQPVNHDVIVVGLQNCSHPAEWTAALSSALSHGHTAAEETASAVNANAVGSSATLTVPVRTLGSAVIGVDHAVKVSSAAPHPTPKQHNYFVLLCSERTSGVVCLCFVHATKKHLFNTAWSTSVDLDGRNICAAIGLSIADSATWAFVTCDLDSRPDHAQRRTYAFLNLMQRVKASCPKLAAQQPSVYNAFDHLFCLGSLNYSVGLSPGRGATPDASMLEDLIVLVPSGRLDTSGVLPTPSYCYDVNVRTDSVQWTVSLYYRDLVAVHGALHKQLGASATRLPKLPAASIGESPTPAPPKARLLEIQHFLQALVRDRDNWTCKTLLLMLDDHIGTLAQRFRPVWESQEEAAVGRTLDLADRKQWKTLADHDQLRHLMAADGDFYGFQEGALRFEPTYPCERAAPGFDEDCGRPVSFADRVLWRSLNGRSNDVHLLEYSSIPTLLGSDHRPVRASVRVAVMPPFTMLPSQVAASPSELEHVRVHLEAVAVQLPRQVPSMEVIGASNAPGTVAIQWSTAYGARQWGLPAVGPAVDDDATEPDEHSALYYSWDAAILPSMHLTCHPSRCAPLLTATVVSRSGAVVGVGHLPLGITSWNAATAVPGEVVSARVRHAADAVHFPAKAFAAAQVDVIGPTGKVIGSISAQVAVRVVSSVSARAGALRLERRALPSSTGTSRLSARVVGSLSCEVGGAMHVQDPQGGFDVFQLQLTCQGLSWTVWRRLSDVTRVLAILESLLPPAIAAALPAPPAVDRSSDMDTDAAVMDQLVRSILHVPQVWRCEELISLLDSSRGSLAALIRLAALLDNATDAQKFENALSELRTRVRLATAVTQALAALAPAPRRSTVESRVALQTRPVQEALPAPPVQHSTAVVESKESPKATVAAGVSQFQSYWREDNFAAQPAPQVFSKPEPATDILQAWQWGAASAPARPTYAVGIFDDDGNFLEVTRPAEEPPQPQPQPTSSDGVTVEDVEAEPSVELEGSSPALNPRQRARTLRVTASTPAAATPRPGPGDGSWLAETPRLPAAIPYGATPTALRPPSDMSWLSPLPRGTSTGSWLAETPRLPASVPYGASAPTPVGSGDGSWLAETPRLPATIPYGAADSLGGPMSPLALSPAVSTDSFSPRTPALGRSGSESSSDDPGSPTWRPSSASTKAGRDLRTMATIRAAMRATSE